MPIDYKELKSSHLNGIYKDFAEVLGIKTTLQIYRYYKGLQITFPVRLLDKSYVEVKIRREYNGKNIKYLARKYGYSERWVRKIINS